MIAVDSNILVYSHRQDSNWYEAADACLGTLAESGHDWMIPWPCLHEFLAICTHPKIYDPPTPLTDALKQVECWLQCPSLVTMSEASGYWKTLSVVLQSSKVDGPRIHDARIAAICIQYGVKELWTADRDFQRFQGLKTKNPLVSPLS